jgi:hypothetical protein
MPSFTIAAVAIVAISVVQFLFADSCKARLILCYLLCPAGDTRPSEACAVSWNIVMLLADGLAWQHHLCHVVLAFFLFWQTSTLVGCIIKGVQPTIVLWYDLG